MKHTIKLLTLAAILTAVFGLTGCPGPVNNYIEPVHEHVFGDWSDWEVVTAATCTKDGSKKRTRTCSCGEIEEETAVLGHNWVLESDTATCTEDGVKTYKCSRCNETRTEDSPAHHTFIAGGCDKCGTYQYADGIKFHLCVTTQEKYNEEYGNNTNTVMLCSSTQSNDNSDIWDDYYLSFDASNLDELVEKYGNLFGIRFNSDIEDFDYKLPIDRLLNLKNVNKDFKWYKAGSTTIHTEENAYTLGLEPEFVYHIVTTN